MKNILIFLSAIITISFIGCKNKSEKLNEKIVKNTKTYLTSEILKDKEYERIDSLKFIKTDTISELHEALMYVEYLTNRSKLNMELSKINDFGGNQSSKIYLDSSSYYAQKASRIIDNFAKYDSIRPLYLQTVFYTQVKLKNATVEKDTLKVTTDLAGNIIIAKEILKSAEKRYQ